MVVSREEGGENEKINESESPHVITISVVVCACCALLVLAATANRRRKQKAAEGKTLLLNEEPDPKRDLQEIIQNAHTRA